MAQILINLGTGANTKDGDTVRLAFSKVNSNFSELYDTLGPNLIPTQDGNGGLFLTTNGTELSWASATGSGVSNELTNGEYTLSLGSDGVVTAPFNSTLHVNTIKHTNGDVVTLANNNSTAKVEVFDTGVLHPGGSVEITAGTGKWKFSGGFTPPRFILPNGGYIAQNTNGAIQLGTPTAVWTFLKGGDLVLPLNGIIKNNDGTPYAGGLSLGNFTFDNSTMHIPVFGGGSTSYLNAGGVGRRNSVQLKTSVSYMNSDINTSEIALEAGNGGFSAQVYGHYTGGADGAGGPTLVYAGVENVSGANGPGFAGFVAIDPGVTSQYAVGVDEGGKIYLNLFDPVTTDVYTAALGVLTSDINQETGQAKLNGIAVTPDFTALTGKNFISMSTDRGMVFFGNQPECLGGENHFHIMPADSSATDLFFGNDTNYVKLPRGTGNVVVGAGGPEWTFDSAGILNFPNNNGQIGQLEAPYTGLEFRTGSGADWIGISYGEIEDNNTSYFYFDKDGSNYLTDNHRAHLQIKNPAHNGHLEWLFDSSGTLTLPQNATIADTGNSVVIVPNSLSSDFQLEIKAYQDIVTPDDIHIRANNTNYGLVIGDSNGGSYVNVNGDNNQNTVVISTINKNDEERKDFTFDVLGNFHVPGDVTVSAVGAFKNSNGVRAAYINEVPLDISDLTDNMSLLQTNQTAPTDIHIDGGHALAVFPAPLSADGGGSAGRFGPNSIVFNGGGASGSIYDTVLNGGGA